VPMASTKLTNLNATLARKLMEKLVSCVDLLITVTNVKMGSIQMAVVAISVVKTLLRVVLLAHFKDVKHV